MKVLICEKCGLIHRIDYDGLRCKNAGCQGKLIPVSIDFAYPEGGEKDGKAREPPKSL